MTRFIKGIGVVYTFDSGERELVGKVLNGLRRLGGKDIGFAKARAFLVSNCDLTDEEAIIGLDLCVNKTQQVQKHKNVIVVDEGFIREYGAEEHKVKAKRQVAKEEKSQPPTLRKVTRLQPRANIEAKPCVAAESDIQILKQILTGQPGGTMPKRQCRTALRSRGVGQTLQDLIFRRVESDGLISYGVINDREITMTWVGPSTNRAISTPAYIVIKRSNG